MRTAPENDLLKPPNADVVDAQFERDVQVSETDERWIVGKLKEDPSYRPYCMNCSTMQRLTLREENGRRTLTCDIVAETHEGAITLMARFGIPPRIGCGGSYDVDTGEFLVQPRTIKG